MKVRDVTLLVRPSATRVPVLVLVPTWEACGRLTFDLNEDAGRVSALRPSTHRCLTFQR